MILVVSEEASVNAEKSLLELAPEERTTSFQSNIQSFSVGKQSFPTSKVDIHIIRRKQAKIDMKRERKATKTVNFVFLLFLKHTPATISNEYLLVDYILWKIYFFMKIYFMEMDCMENFFHQILTLNPNLTLT